jgi:hypothetical protein
MNWSFHPADYELFDLKRAEKYIHNENNPKALQLQSFFFGITNS